MPCTRLAFCTDDRIEVSPLGGGGGGGVEHGKLCHNPRDLTTHKLVGRNKRHRGKGSAQNFWGPERGGEGGGGH